VYDTIPDTSLAVLLSWCLDDPTVSLLCSSTRFLHMSLFPNPQVVPGELTIVTGVPNSGKSEFIDALLCNLSELHGWTFAMCSMEKKAIDHARQLAEKYVGQPFFDLPYSKGVQRMSYEQLDAALDWVDDKFHLIRYEDDELPNIDWVLEVAKAAVYRYGIRGLVIDPYNELDHQRPANMNETEYVSQMLTKVKRFAQTAGVHVWFVAHPRQMREWKGQAPNLYDISGSAHFINKADNGVVVHRVRDPGMEAKVQILVRKVRNKAAGTIGDATLEYERVNGRYVDPGAGAEAPRTSRKMGWASGGNAGNGGGNQWEPKRMYHHSDGSVNSDPPSFD
jgi:twinkle protein